MSEQEEMKIMPLLQQNKTFTTEFRGVRYDYYLTGAIGDPEDYLDLCNILRSAGSQDEVVIRINSQGGQVRTGNMIINAINESDATVIGFIESDCASMATYIFLACDTWGVSEAAEFMAHTCSYGAWGKENENFSQMEFMRRQQHKMIRTRYKDFLDEIQIETILSGGDIYLDADEIMERLGSYSEARKQACDCPECQSLGEGDESLDLMAIIEQNVAEGVEKALGNILKKYDLVEKPKPVRKKKATSKEIVDKSVEGE